MARPAPAHRGFGILLMACAALAAPCRAADPQAYRVRFENTGQAELDQALKDSSMLEALRQKTAVGPYALIARARDDQSRFQAALRSFGYYAASLDIRVNGLPVDDPALPERLVRAPAKPPAEVTVAARTGPLFRLRRIDIRGHAPATARARLELKPGDPALAPKVLEARQKLLDALLDQGHALAKVDEPVATLLPESHQMDVRFAVDAGPIVQLGEIKLEGLQRMNREFVRRRVSVKTGDRFDAAAIDETRQALAAIGVFSSVRVRRDNRLDGQGCLPISFEVAERPLRTVSFNANYSTDLGASLAAGWQHRNLFGNAERLTFSAGVTQLGGSGTHGVGYHAAAGFVRPDFLRHDQDLHVDLGAVRQNLIPYDRQAVTGGVGLNRRIGTRWNFRAGIAAEQERVTQQGASTDFTLLSLPLSARYDGSDDLLNPTRGLRATALITPTQPIAGPSTRPFVLLQLEGSTYLDLDGRGRNVLALRGLVGDAVGAAAGDLPPDKRFYAGGSATVRGYAYQSLGPQFADRTPRGGSSLLAGSVEFRRRFLEDYGAVVFVDAGQVNAEGPSFTADWRLGAGLGLRYYTGIGPIRLDFALPLNRQPGGDTFELYIGLGQAF